MIYDKLLTVYDLDETSTGTARSLINPRTYMYGEKEVYGSTFFRAMQAGEQVDAMVEMWRQDIHARQYCVLPDNNAYQIVQARHGNNADGLPITTLSLRRYEGRYTAAES